MKTKLVLTVLVFFVSERVYSGFEQDLDSINEKIRKQESELERYKKSINQIDRTLNHLDERKEEIVISLENLETQMISTRKKVDDIEKDINYAERNIEIIEDKLDYEMRKGKQYGMRLDKALKGYFYEKNLELPWYVEIMSKENNKMKFYKAKYLDYETNRYKESEESIREKRELKNSLQEQKRKQLDRKQEVFILQGRLIQKNKKHMELLEEIEEDRKEKERELLSVKKEKEKLSSLVTSLKEKAENIERLDRLAEDFVKAKGGLPWPLKGEVVIEFGRQRHSQLDTVIYNRGIEIKPEDERTVKSVGFGEVVYADYFSGKGNMVVIEHGKNYYTIYGNLKNVGVEVAQEVEPAQEIGELSLENLYFELGRGSQPENPIEWLK